MKIIFVIAIMILSFFVGYSYKNIIKKRAELYLYLKELNSNLKSNINLFKTNIVEIIDNFLGLKTAKFNEIFIKNNQIYSISSEKLKKYLDNEQEITTILNYFNSIGSSDYDYELKRFNEFGNYFDDKIAEHSDEIKNKGELFFKIALSVGAVIAILIW